MREYVVANVEALIDLFSRGGHHCPTDFDDEGEETCKKGDSPFLWQRPIERVSRIAWAFPCKKFTVVSCWNILRFFRLAGENFDARFRSWRYWWYWWQGSRHLIAMRMSAYQSPRPWGQSDGVFSLNLCLVMWWKTTCMHMWMFGCSFVALSYLNSRIV